MEAVSPPPPAHSFHYFHLQVEEYDPETEYTKEISLLPERITQLQTRIKELEATEKDFLANKTYETVRRDSLKVLKDHDSLLDWQYTKLEEEISAPWEGGLGQALGALRDQLATLQDQQANMSKEDKARVLPAEEAKKLRTFASKKVNKHENKGHNERERERKRTEHGIRSIRATTTHAVDSPLLL